MFKVRVVRIRRIADESEQDIPLKSWNYIKDDIDDVTRGKKFELIGYYGKDEKLVEGDPNQVPQQQVVASQNADLAGNAGENVVKRKTRAIRPAEVKLQETQA